MMFSSRFTVRRPSPARAVLVGGLASVAFLVEQAIDRRLLPNRYDDLVLWGGFVTRRPALQRALGLTVHFSLGTALAAAYEAEQPSLPKWNPVLLGILFTQTENAILWPTVPVMNAIHPEVRRGGLPPLTAWRYLVVELLRHVAYGAVLGALTARLEAKR
jgi:hypothetical protein